MSEFAREVDLTNVSNMADIAARIRDGIEHGHGLPYDRFLGSAAQFGTEEGARQVFEACAGITSLSERGLDRVARDYQRIESWARAIMDGSPEALTRPYVDELASANIPDQGGIADLGGGVMYAGKIDREQLEDLRGEASGVEGAKFFCFVSDGLAVMPMPGLAVETIGDARVDFENLLANGVLWMGSDQAGQAFMPDEKKLPEILRLLGAESTP